MEVSDAELDIGKLGIWKEVRSQGCVIYMEGVGACSNCIFDGIGYGE